MCLPKTEKSRPSSECNKPTYKIYHKLAYKKITARLDQIFITFLIKGHSIYKQSFYKKNSGRKVHNNYYM